MPTHTPAHRRRRALALTPDAPEMDFAPRFPGDGTVRPRRVAPVGLAPRPPAPVTVPVQPQPPTVPGGSATTAPAPAPVTPSSTTQPITTFTATENLRPTQINPVASDATQRARALALESLEGLADTPDRTQLAQDAFRLILEGSEDARRLGTQQIARDAARLGRIGSGMVTTDLGNLEERIRRSEDQAARALALEAAGSTLSDRQAVLQSLLGGAGFFDTTDRADRGELRLERGRQDQLAQQSIENFVRQQMLQDALLNSAFGRELDLSRALAAVGFGGGNPANTALDVANQFGQGAAQAGASVGQILQLLAMMRQLGGGGSGTTIPSDPAFGGFA